MSHNSNKKLPTLALHFYKLRSYDYLIPDDADELQALGDLVAEAIYGANTLNSSYYVAPSAIGLYATAGASDDWTSKSYCSAISKALSKNGCRKTPKFYVWTENVAGRGSNEVGSALLHFLRHAQFNESVNKIRLFCDGCGGQNKNSLHMLMSRHMKQSCTGFIKPHFTLRSFESKIHIKDIEIVFPVRGHSYLPADRVFGRVEKELRRHDRIILPSDYTDIYKKFGEVFELEKDWRVYDLKGLLTIFQKYHGISEQKVVNIKKIESW
ncbi:uncharacterized protein LOC115889209 [Sitophilus oryzae]|uniref:Uncharacterized protein LOC115889209 n=1 Tax=Sitophilus oryzae TaxID=7048 RepID=A0A6J2YP23_SITOR|nr:uncharacterized protein LOC115889209 [Sitophilus oryzae]